MSRIAVFGATGYLGGFAVRRLLTDHHRVVAVTRHPDWSKLPSGVELVQADVTIPGTLPAALAGVDGVVIALNGGSDPERAELVEERAMAHIAVAAERAGVSRILLITGMFAQSQYAEYPWEQATARGIGIIMGCSIPATVFRVGFVNETLARFMRRGKPVLIGRHLKQVRPIAAEDVMFAASRAFALPHTADMVYDVAGQRPMTLRKALADYAYAVTDSVVAPSEVKILPLPLMGALNQLFMKGEMTRPLEILASMDRYGDVTDTTAWFRDFGLPPTPFEDWLQQQNTQARIRPCSRH